MNRAVRAGLWILGVGVGFVFLKQMLGHYGNQGGGSASQWAHPTPLPAALAAAGNRPVADSLKLELRPHSGGSDSIFVADITINNLSASSVSDIAITCDALGDNGETTGHAAATLHGVFTARATRTEANVELRFIHKPVSARCAVADFTIGP